MCRKKIQKNIEDWEIIVLSITLNFFRGGGGRFDPYAVRHHPTC